MLTKRIIACLDVKDGKVVKGVKFKDHKVLGDAAELAAKYRDQGVDELVFYDIAASAEGRRVPKVWVRSVARLLDIPFCVAGGIRGVADAEEVLGAGADKVSINSPALERPALIDELAKRFGNQCVVVGVDSRREDGNFRTYQYTGIESRSKASGRDMLDWISEAQDRGAGEIVLNCMDSDGTSAGYDIDQLKAARAKLTVPLVASGGARTVEHFRAAFTEAKVDAALAAGAFHRGELTVGEVKQGLAKDGILVRP